jgi:hypothetical protein
VGDISTTKLDAARRQIDAGIRMLFANEDPFAIQTVVGAGNRILRDIADATVGSSAWHEGIKGIIAPGMEGRFWQAMNKAANFLKHADTDPDDVLVVEEELSDSLLLHGCMYYHSLGHDHTPEMRAFMSWHMVMYPELLLNGEVRAMASHMIFDDWRRKPRVEKLGLGRELLIKNMVQ